MTDHHNHTHTDRAAAPLAISLWIVVTIGLLYGIIQTAGDTAALFTG